MNFPSSGPGRETQSAAAAAELLLVPTPIVVNAETLLPSGASVLDLGAWNGRNGFYLAGKGHDVTSVETEQEYIDAGWIIAAQLGDVGLRNTFICGDMTELIGGLKDFDATVATHSLHMVAKTTLNRTVAGIQNSVKPSGLNIVQSYVASPEEQTLAPNRAFFTPNELFRIYRGNGWDVIDQVHHPGEFRRNAEDGKIHFSSSDALIARRPVKKRRTYMNANRELIEIED